MVGEESGTGRAERRDAQSRSLLRGGAAAWHIDLAYSQPLARTMSG
jgi:hypothetical protein